jgi:hypothetical protein
MIRVAQGEAIKMRTLKHYEKILSDNPDTTIGFTLAADMVYAALHGQCDVSDHINQQWRDIARRLKSRYGENLTADEVRLEMATSNAAAIMGRKGGSVKSEKKTTAVRENAQKGGRPKSPFITTDTDYDLENGFVWTFFSQGPPIREGYQKAPYYVQACLSQRAAGVGFKREISRNDDGVDDGLSADENSAAIKRFGLETCRRVLYREARRIGIRIAP